MNKAQLKVTPQQLRAMADHLDGRQTWTNPITVSIDGDILRYDIKETGEIRTVVGIRPITDS